MSEINPLFFFRPVVRQCDDDHLVLRQPLWVGPVFWAFFIVAALDLFRWAWAWKSTGWPGIWALPWIAIVLLTQWSWWCVKSLTLDRSLGILKIAYFLGRSRQRPLPDVLTVQMAVFHQPWTDCLLRLVLKGRRSFAFAVCGGRRPNELSALVGKVADFLAVPRADQDPGVAWS